MTIEKLIKELKKYENDSVEVFVYFNDNIHDIDMVDLSIGDRVDINIFDN